MVKFASSFCYCAVVQEKADFQWKPGVSCRSALLGPEMVKFASNFCYCAVDQEKVVFQWKRAHSGPSALLGPEMVKFASNFCYCAANQEKAFLNGNGPLLAHLPFQWPEMVKFALIALAKPSVEGPCRALHAEGYPLPERTPKMIGMRGDGCDPLQRRRNPKP